MSSLISVVALIGLIYLLNNHRKQLHVHQLVSLGSQKPSAGSSANNPASRRKSAESRCSFRELMALSEVQPFDDSHPLDAQQLKTNDRLLRRQLLYPAELREQTLQSCQ